MKESEYFQSQEFKENFRKQVEKDTWEKGLPMIYNDKNGNMIEHWKDGTINILKENVSNSKTFVELFKGTNIEPQTDENGNIFYQLKANKK